jgi:hypothetical protein
MTDTTYAMSAPKVAGAGGDLSAVSGVSWAAVLAGALVAAAVSILLVALGAGLGFATAAPFNGRPQTAAAFSIMAGIWLILTQWIASGFGGYITGRLRTKWANLHTHEVFFRDTANGFVMWATATVMVALLTAGAGLLAASRSSANAIGHADAPGPYAYEVDRLFRSGHPDDSASAQAVRAEAARILAAETTGVQVNAEDRGYLAQMVASRTGVPISVAQSRVDTAIDLARDEAKTAARSASATGVFTALAMLIGAFIACVAGALGGRQRDEHP